MDTDTERNAAAVMASTDEFEAEEEAIVEDDEMALLNEEGSSRRRDSVYSRNGSRKTTSTWGQVKETVIEVSHYSTAAIRETN